MVIACDCHGYKPGSSALFLSIFATFVGVPIPIAPIDLWPPLPVGADRATAAPQDPTPRCPRCGTPLRIVELLPPQPRDTS